jgi:hypothetical protein
VRDFSSACAANDIAATKTVRGSNAIRTEPAEAHATSSIG